uniref:Protein kinase domain-containing protein n=1 Tax=Parascaris univalens TaxID=6257 RepID=A0A914ZYI6_PARUN
MWSVGCVLAGIIFKKDPFFHGNDNSDQVCVKPLYASRLFHCINKFCLSGVISRIVCLVQM